LKIRIEKALSLFAVEINVNEKSEIEAFLKQYTFNYF
jgi:hypothetical protein